MITIIAKNRSKCVCVFALTSKQPGLPKIDMQMNSGITIAPSKVQSFAHITIQAKIFIIIMKHRAILSRVAYNNISLCYESVQCLRGWNSISYWVRFGVFSVHCYVHWLCSVPELSSHMLDAHIAPRFQKQLIFSIFIQVQHQTIGEPSLFTIAAVQSMRRQTERCCTFDTEKLFCFYFVHSCKNTLLTK